MKSFENAEEKVFILERKWERKKEKERATTTHPRRVRDAHGEIGSIPCFGLGVREDHTQLYDRL